jgi:hypothetical protein
MNAIQNADYAPWIGNASTRVCPYVCNAGYQLGADILGRPVCDACQATYYSQPGGACTPCVAPANGYILHVPRPGNQTDVCIFDCNAGYELAGAGCAVCAANYFQNSLRTATGQPPNRCTKCTPCVPTTFMTVQCTSTNDYSCQACQASCGAGNYISAKCGAATNTQCTPCKTSCAAGYYLSPPPLEGCPGQTTGDLIACIRCTTPDKCVPGSSFMTRVCTGTTTTDQVCVPCTYVTLTPGQYVVRCSGFTDNYAHALPACPPLQYLADAGIYSPGTCKACTICSSLGLRQIVACSTYADAECGGMACSAGAPCTPPSYCDFTATDTPSSPSAVGNCGLCPSGFGSDGLSCLRCPRGATCNVHGAALCTGECAAGQTSGCRQGALDPATSYAVCSPQTCSPPEARFVVDRASYVQAAACTYAYFTCAVGFYLEFAETGVLDCLQCSINYPTPGGVFATQGLSPNDPTR